MLQRNYYLARERATAAKALLSELTRLDAIPEAERALAVTKAKAAAVILDNATTRELAIASDQYFGGF